MESIELRNILLVKSIKSPFFWLLCLFILTAKGHLEIIDTDYSLRTAISILENSSMRIKPTDPEFIKYSVNPDVDGLIYSQYGIGLPILFIPFIISAQAISSFINIPQDIVISFLVSFYNIPFAILGLWFTREILKNLGVNLKQANATIVIIATCTAFWHYAVSDFSEVTQFTLLLGCFYAILSKYKIRWLLFSFWYTSLLSVKVAYLILAPFFFVFGVYECKRRKSSILKEFFFGSFFILPFGVFLAYINFIRFGDILEFGYGNNLSTVFDIRKLLPLIIPSLFSLNYGIMLFNPIILVFPLWIKIFNIRKSFAYLVLFIIVSWFCLMCCYGASWGWGWGQRYLFIIIPLLVLPIAYLPSINLRKSVKVLFISLTISSGFIQLMSVSTKFHEPFTMKLELKDKFQGSNVGQLSSTFLLFQHKLLNGSVNYPLSIIGGNHKESIDLSDYDSFRGFNFWPVHMMKFFKLDNHIRIFELILLSVIIFLQFLLLRTHLPYLLGNRSRD
jgi:hypothetical protein